jgi:hypothetical protein
LRNLLQASTKRYCRHKNVLHLRLLCWLLSNVSILRRSLLDNHINSKQILNSLNGTKFDTTSFLCMILLFLQSELIKVCLKHRLAKSEIFVRKKRLLAARTLTCWLYIRLIGTKRRNQTFTIQINSVDSSSSTA